MGKEKISICRKYNINVGYVNNDNYKQQFYYYLVIKNVFKFLYWNKYSFLVLYFFPGHILFYVYIINSKNI